MMAYKKIDPSKFWDVLKIGRLRQVERVGSEYDMIINRLDGMT